MGQGKIGLWIAGACAAVMVLGIGYGMGRRAALRSVEAESQITPAGAPLPTIQIEPIQPQEELAAISASSGPQEAQGPGLAEMDSSAAVEVVVVDQTQADARQVQIALKNAGFDPGPLDGQMGPRTQSAVRNFQRANGLEDDGKVGSRTWAKLSGFLEGSSSSQ